MRSITRTGLVMVLVITSSILLTTVNATPVTLGSNVKINTIYGNLVTVIPMLVQRLTVGGGTININITGLELNQIIYSFFATAYGNGSFQILVTGQQPLFIKTSAVNNYAGGAENIVYSSIITNDPLILCYTVNCLGQFAGPESQRVLFKDDFLYTNPLLESSWIIDRYNTNLQSGFSTSSGYMLMTAQPVTLTTHVTSPAYNTTSTYPLPLVFLKRKLTVTLVPFQKKETPATSSLHIGFSGLVTDTNMFPGSSNPYGTPSAAANDNTCNASSNTIGNEYFYITNAGYVEADACGDPSGTKTFYGLETLDPTLYTVLTLETAGISCTVCQDNVFLGSSWVYYRIYQRDNAGILLTSTDKNINFTSGIAPYFGTNYIMLSQATSNGASTGQISKIDLVQLQNYGSPVCLNVPGSILCTKLPPIPKGLGSGLISDIAWLAFEIGFGDEQLGAVIMFLIMATGFSFVPFILTRNYLIGGTGLLLVFSFFIYAGFIPTWMLFMPIFMGAVLTVLLVNRMLGSHSLIGGGGTSE